METLLWAERVYERTKREEEEESVTGENYSACRKISSRLAVGQRIEPVTAGNVIAPLSTSPAEPVEKLFFLAFDNHRITSDSQRMDQRMMCAQFSSKPVRPFRDSRNSVDVGDGGPNKSLVRACQQNPSRARRHVS